MNNYKIRMWSGADHFVKADRVTVDGGALVFRNRFGELVLIIAAGRWLEVS